MFVKHHQVSLKDATNSTDESVFHPLPALFRLLGLSPFKKVVVGSVSLVFNFLGFLLYLCYVQSKLLFFLAACGVISVTHLLVSIVREY